MSEERSAERGQADDQLAGDERDVRQAFASPKKSMLLSRAREIFGDALTLVVLTGRKEQEQEAAPARNLDLNLALAALADRQNAHSLRTAVDIAQELLEVEAKSTVQAWFVGQNPLLDDRAPALIVRTDPDAVWDAAKHFVAYG